MNKDEIPSVVITNSMIQLLNGDGITKSSVILSADTDAGTLTLSDGQSVAGISHTNESYHFGIASKYGAGATLGVDTKTNKGSLMLAGRNGTPLFARGWHSYGD